MKTIWHNDYFLRALSLVLAIVAWFYIILVQNPEIEQTYKNVAVTINDGGMLEANNLVVTTKQKPVIDVKVRASRKSLANFSKENINAYVDISGITRVGEFTVPVNVYIQDSSVNIINKNPYNITVRIDNFKGVNLPVEVRIENEPKQGFSVIDTVCEPEIINLQGPEAVLKGIEKAVATVDVSGLEESISKTVEYELYDSTGAIIRDTSIIKSTASVKIDIKIMSTKEIPVNANIINTNNEYELDLENSGFEPDTILIAGEKEALDAMAVLDLGSIELFIKEGQNEYDIPLNLPNGLISVDDIKTVRYFVDASIIKDKSVKIEKINIINADDMYIYEINNSDKVISVYGKESLLNTLEASDIKISIDVDGLKPGTHIVIPELKMPDGISVRNNYTIEVKVIEKQ